MNQASIWRHSSLTFALSDLAVRGLPVIQDAGILPTTVKTDNRVQSDILATLQAALSVQDDIPATFD